MRNYVSLLLWNEGHEETDQATKWRVPCDACFSVCVWMCTITLYQALCFLDCHLVLVTALGVIFHHAHF